MRRSSGKRRVLPPPRDLSAQVRATAPVLIAVYLVSLVALGLVSFLHLRERVNAYFLIDDAVTLVGGLPLYTGFFTYVGVLVWCVAATAGVLGGALLWRTREAGELAPFLLTAGGLSALFTLDDLFLLHEQGAELLVGYEARHEGQALILLVYAAMMVAIFARFRWTIRRTEFLLLGLALVSLGASVAIDVVLTLDVRGRNPILDVVVSRPWGGPIADFSEELLKLNGILLWCAYLVRTSFSSVQTVMRPENTATSDRPSAAPGRARARSRSRRR